MNIRLITAQITRDAMTRLPSTVCAHELRILKTVFGQDNVQVINEDAGSVELDPSAEGERLAGKYGEAVMTRLFGELFKDAIEQACVPHEPTKAKAKAAVPA